MNKYQSTPMKLGESETTGFVFSGIHRLPHDEKKKLETTPFCEACVNSSHCEYDQGSDCPFQIIGRDGLLNRLIVYAYDTNGDCDDQRVIDSLREIFSKVYNGADIDIYSGCINNVVCDKCNGAGVHISDEIKACNKCNGTGLLSHKIEDGFHKAYITFDRVPYTDTVIQWDDTSYYEIFEDETLARKSVDYFNANIANSFQCIMEREYATILMSDRLTGADFGCLSNGGDSEDGEQLIVLDTESNNEIVAVGDWKEIHDLLRMSYYVDVEHYTGGKYVVETMKQFKLGYQIVSNTQMDKLYQQVYSNIIATCMQCASYGGVESLIISYTSKYPTITDIRNNIMKYLTPASSYVLASEYNAVVDKVIDDFSLIGLQISKAEAAKVVSDASTTTDESIIVSNIMNYNAVGVYLIEYVLILKEFEGFEG